MLNNIFLKGAFKTSARKHKTHLKVNAEMRTVNFHTEDRDHIVDADERKLLQLKRAVSVHCHQLCGTDLPSENRDKNSLWHDHVAV